MTQWSIQDRDKILADAETSNHWAHYDFNGTRIAAGSDWSCTPSADELAAWDAEAPAKAVELVTKHNQVIAEERHTAQLHKGSVKASFAGRCAVTGRSFGRGARIRKTNLGWAISDDATFASVVGVDPEFAADERDALIDDLRTAERERAFI